MFETYVSAIMHAGPVVIGMEELIVLTGRAAEHILIFCKGIRQGTVNCDWVNYSELLKFQIVHDEHVKYIFRYISNVLN